MPSIFPSLCAFRGVGGIVGKLPANVEQANIEMGETIKRTSEGIFPHGGYLYL
jgi:hypothetical protein